MGAMANDSTASYVDWEEVVVSSEKGRREVHYYLKRNGGEEDLVVVGKEKSVRHMSYYYAMKDNKALLSNLRRCSILKLRSRRDVIDWLKSILTGERADGYFGQFGDDLECKLDLDNIKDAQTQRLSRYRTEFMWIGSPWTCRKRRRHYESFCRNGVVISVQDFVYVLAEEGKRLVAYLDDMYEDPRGNKMVVVRWFHRIDEVGFVLPHNYNDREIFFSLCLQDLSVECVDGQATVLSLEHYEKFMSKDLRMGLEPFVCYRQFDNDDVKPFDITIIKGYWKQELLEEMFSPSVLEPIDEDREVKFSLGDDTVGCRPNKRIRWSKESELFSNHPSNKREHVENLKVCSGGSVDHKGNLKIDSWKEGCSHASLSKLDDAMLSNCGPYLTVGSRVELLSQDSGIRGCWFRALIVKKHKDKVKVQYQDVKDAIDDTKNLEEWILASRLATPDVLGIRVSGRAIVRPTPLSDERSVSCVVNVGSSVDAWWHDGWWEGIVVKNNSVNKFHVYFPGEKKEQIFSVSDLRQSQEWTDNGWENIKDRPEIISTLLKQEMLSSTNKDAEIKLEAGSFGKGDFSLPVYTNDLPKKVSQICGPMEILDIKMPNDLETIRDLSKDLLLTQLRWKTSGKRRRSRSPVHKLCYGADCDYSGMHSFEKLLVNTSLKFDPDNCKYANDSHINSSVVSPMTSLVMSR